jgi:hypothetical protein
MIDKILVHGVHEIEIVWAGGFSILLVKKSLTEYNIVNGHQRLTELLITAAERW